MLDLRWLRAFPPWQIKGQYHRIGAIERECDTLDYVQLQTPRERRGLWEAREAYVHFNWAISIYRFFQRAAGAPFEDDRFLILLIRLLSDAFAPSTEGGAGDLPTVDELALGITDPEARVTYRRPNRPERYGRFRALIGRLLEGSLIEPERAEVIERALSPFDAA